MGASQTKYSGVSAKANVEGAICHLCGGDCRLTSERYLALGGIDERENLFNALGTSQRFTTRSVLTAFHAEEEEIPAVSLCARCGSASCLLCAQVLLAVTLEHLPNIAANGVLARAHRRSLVCCELCRPTLAKRAIRLMQEAHVKLHNNVNCEEDDDGFIIVGSESGINQSGTPEARLLLGDVASLRLADAIELLRAHPKNALLWHHVSTLVPLHRGLSLSLEGEPDVTVSAVCCMGRALLCDPQNLQYLLRLAYHLSHIEAVKFWGEEHTAKTIAILAVERHPENSLTWMCAAGCCREGFFIINGKEVTRQDMLQNSVDLSPKKRDILYQTAFLLCRATGALVVDGKTRTRHEILLGFMNEEPMTLSLQSLVEEFFGSLFVTQVLVDMCLQYPDHPRVLARNAMYTVDSTIPIGAGAFGTVFPASFKDPTTKKMKRLAVKVTSADHLGDKATVCASTELLLSTVHMLRGVVVSAEHVMLRPEEGKLYTFMERARDGSALAYLQRLGGRMHEPHLRHAMQELGHALELLHFYGVIHQDLKPANILVFSGETMKLTDFGVSSVTHCTSHKHEVGGTAAYMPPEALHDGVVSTAGDVWSFAMTIIELASGCVPSPDPAYLNVEGARSPFRPYIPSHLSGELRDILASMLAYDPSKRPTMKEVLARPYFSRLELPPDSEPVEAYRAHVGDTGIPSPSEDGSSTMGLTTQRLSTTTTIRS